jgi:hypothetical protein
MVVQVIASNTKFQEQQILYTVSIFAANRICGKVMVTIKKVIAAEGFF